MKPLKGCLLFLGFVGLLGAAPPPEWGQTGLVAADHILASEAGATLLAQGGNAVDAAIAAVLASGVVQPAGSGLGGGGFAVVVDPSGESFVLDFREVAPQAATEGMFVESDDENASRYGGMAVGVPGEAPGLVALHARFGARPLREVVQPAMNYARSGFSVGPYLAEGFAKLPPDVADNLSLLLFGRSGNLARKQVVQRPTLARSLRALVRSEGREFQTGSIAADIVEAVQAAGGVLTAADMASYAPVERQPVVGTYRDWTVITMPPPSSGGLVLLQALSVLEGHTLSEMDHNSAAYIHLLAETFQHAFADRANHMGDPDRVDVPVDALLSADRIQEIQQHFDATTTHERAAYGTAVDIGQDGGTLHVSAMDEQGWSVAITSTINTSFGSRVVAPRSGILLNNEMDDFVARPGVPNAYGLIGSQANAVAPGARPLSSMTPTVLISPDGQQRIAVGASGGPWIISSTLQAIVNVIDFGMDPSEAVSVPRVHHQWVPEVLGLDEGISADTRHALEALGHETRQYPFFSSVQMTVWGDEGIEGASDPRKGGWPASPAGG